MDVSCFVLEPGNSSLFLIEIVWYVCMSVARCVCVRVLYDLNSLFVPFDPLGAFHIQETAQSRPS